MFFYTSIPPTGDIYFYLGTEGKKEREKERKRERKRERERERKREREKERKREREKERKKGRKEERKKGRKEGRKKITTQELNYCKSKTNSKDDLISPAPLKENAG